MRAVRMGVASLSSAFILLIFLIHLWITQGSRSEGGVQSVLKGGSSIGSTRVGSLDSSIRNETLGFQKVFVLNLPSRGDRLDAFILSASLAGFTVETMPGIDGSGVPNKALPSTEGLSDDINFRNAQVGTWRAHLNVARRIVQERISSALIIEDDSDWDVSIKDRLVDFAHGARHFSEGATGKKSKTPYGDAWDMLWLGHCGIEVHSDKSEKGPPTGVSRQRVLIDNDPTVPPPKKRNSFDWVPDMSGFPDTSRLVFPVNMGLCLYGYALSYSGAQRVLRAQLTRKDFQAIDIGIGRMCGDPALPFRSIGVYPQLIDSHKSAGSEQRDSNIHQGLGHNVREVGYTLNVKYSSRLNTQQLLNGEQPVSQWKEEAEANLPSGKITYRVIDKDAGAAINVWPAHLEPRPDGQTQQ